MFNPSSVLANSIFVPFYFPSNRVSTTISQFKIESTNSGLKSIINLVNSDNNAVIPYFDFSKYDGERQMWYWEDEDGLFYRLIAKGDREYDTLIAKLLISSPSEETYISTYNYVLDGVDINKIVGIESINTQVYNNTTSQLDKRLYISKGLYYFYKYDPIQININGKRITDITAYNGLNQTNLNNIKTDVNMEFYYSFNDNKLYTNQNLTSVLESDVSIKFYTNINSVNVINRMNTNVSTNAKYTPTIDYFIVKLNGQNFRNT
jgi:hypothetical protein